MIYLDHAATAPLDERVFEAMLPFLRPGGIHGNPSSDHVAGREAKAAVERARGQVAALIGAEPSEIIFTSGATEADNLALKGAMEFYRDRGRHIITSRVEHKAVLDTCRYLETQGVRVSYLMPNRDGQVTPEQVMEAVTPETQLVSLMWVNNETGVINDIERLAPMLRERGILFHVDAVQAAGRLTVDMRATPVDLMALSGHKLYGPKGIGALYVRKKPRARVAPQQHGSGHEQGMRSGTLPTHQIAGMGEAFRLAAVDFAREPARLRELRDRLWAGLSSLPDVYLNGEAAPRAPGILNVSFGGVEGESLRAALPELCVSSGSACSSATREPSFVLRSMGRDDRLAGASLRFSLGHQNSLAETDRVAELVRTQVLRLRALSPVAGAAA